MAPAPTQDVCQAVPSFFFRPGLAIGELRLMCAYGECEWNTQMRDANGRRFPADFDPPIRR
jgi:hypothetical protein